MKIVICGSIAFIEEMIKAKQILELRGHIVEMPSPEAKDENGNLMSAKDLYTLRKRGLEGAPEWIWKRNQEGMRDHFNKVKGSEAILVLNHAKNGTDGYIGANTFLEIGLAFHLNKKIYLLHKIPEMNYREEVISMNPSILNGNLELL